MRSQVGRKLGQVLPYALLLLFASSGSGAATRGKELEVSVDAHGNYAIGLTGTAHPALISGIAAEINGTWLRSADYPRHAVATSSTKGILGPARQWVVTFSGLAGKPELIYQLRAYDQEPFADLQVTLRNNTDHSMEVQSLRSVDASGSGAAALQGPAAADRVLSDSFSEDRPAVRIHDLGDSEDEMHRAVGSQLIYNRDSHESLFLGALSSERFLTILRLHVNGTAEAVGIAHYEVESTGTTEMEKENSLKKSAPVDRVELNLPVAPGKEISSEMLAISASDDYHAQLETYGSLIRELHHARVTAPPLMGWWSWTAYYFGLNEGAAITNAEWESEHLKSFGYRVFHIDEGYQYARGEYVTPNATVFPHGLTPVEDRVRGLGLTPGIWTAPFEVSERAWVYQNHPDWLVKNAQGQPIHGGVVDGGGDQLYVLDTTNPGAQQYLRETYTKLVRDWGIRYIKMDFMDDSAIEGYHYKPNTTAMEAQRIGLAIIRKAVGDDVYLDKDGSVMLNPVGYVDYGRISQDTGHTFGASRDAATGMAARYYMNRNFFVSDPDAFTVSEQRITDQHWHEGRQPLTLAEAQVSIALAAVSGGMLEIGDNLPSLENSPDRLALIENRDLIDMVRLGRASVPVDLMSYAVADQQPSIFYLHESDRQSILTVFNWTDEPLARRIRLADLGLATSGTYSMMDIFDQKPIDVASGFISFEQGPHSARVLKIEDTSLPASAPNVTAECGESGKAGENIDFAAHSDVAHPALSYHWKFGDGVELEGANVRHAWTEAGNYTVRLTAMGLNNQSTERTCEVLVNGNVSTVFTPSQNKRYEPR
jgi:alpha-galactosidase